MRHDERVPPRRWAGLGLAGLLLLGAAGCAGRGTVTGKIKYKDRPLGGGTVVFSVPGKGSARAEIGEDGSYRVDGVPAGRAIIMVETRSVAPVRDFARAGPNANLNLRPPADQVPEGAEHSIYGRQDRPGKGAYVAIPERYNDPVQSGLSYDVRSGSQEHDIELE